MTGDIEKSSDHLIDQTNSLRDELLAAVAKLEQYSKALQGEVMRLKRIAEQERELR